MPAILRAADQVKTDLWRRERIEATSAWCSCSAMACDRSPNAAGGIGGRDIVPIVEDDETNAKSRSTRRASW